MSNFEVSTVHADGLASLLLGQLQVQRHTYVFRVLKYEISFWLSANIVIAVYQV